MTDGNSFAWNLEDLYRCLWSRRHMLETRSWIGVQGDDGNRL